MRGAKRIRRVLSAVRHPRRTYRRAVVRATYGWAPRIGSWFRKRWVILKNPHAEIRFGRYCLLDPGFSLHIPFGGRFIVGEAVHFRRGFRAEVWGGASIEIGDLCVFSYYTLIQCGTSISIGNRVMTGQSCGIFDGNHRFTHVTKPLLEQGYNHRALRIEDDVTTLTKVTIVNNIGRKAVVGANSVVARPVPPYSIVGGVPAQMLDYFGPPELEPAEWRERQVARGMPQPSSRPNRLEVSGHSLSFGGGVSAFGNRFTTRLAALIDAEEENRSVGGAIACWHESGADPGDGGYARTLQRFTRTADLHEELEDLTCVVCHGVNDLAILGPQNLTPFEHALRTVISRHRACAVFEEEHPSVRLSAGWTAREADGPDCSGSGVVETASAGETVTIAVPEEFQGGAIALGFVAPPEGGALHRFTVDGADSATLDTRGITALGHRNGAVARLTDLSPGSHQIVCRVLDAAGSTAFDYWQVESSGPPSVLLPLAPPNRNADVYSDWPHNPIQESIDAANDLIRAVASEFGRWVIPVEIAPALERDELWADDGRYPNDEGHAAIARACHEVLTRAAARSVQADVSV
jgi:acetyltransferase-like isoleucine patch superfamily enzyme